MPNKTLTNTEVAVTAIAVLHNNSYMLKVIDKQHSKEFGKTGAQIGSTFNIKRPWRPTVYRQTALAVQNFSEDLVPLTLQYPYQVGLNFTDAELSLSIQDFRHQVLDPAMPALATAIDLDALQMSLNGFRQIGTPGTTLGTASGSAFTGPGPAGMLQNYTSPSWPLFAGALLDDQSAPSDVRREIICTPWTMAATAAGLAGLYNEQKLLAEQFRTGVIPNGTLGFNWAKDQNVRILTTGNRGTGAQPAGLVNGSAQVGANLVTNGWTTGQVNTLNAGEIVMVSNMYHVNPENQQSLTNYYATFVVTSACSSDTNGNMTIPIYPAITPAVASSAYGTTNISPASGSVVTCLSGASNAQYPVNVIFHGDAFTMGTAELVMPSGIDFAARETYDGVTILITRAYDITNLQFPARMDILAGYACTRPELITRGTN